MLAAAPTASADLTYTSNTISGQVITTFTGGSGTWTPPDGVTNVAVLVVGGGGGGGQFGGGGGAGGFIHNNTYSVTPGNAYTVTVGGGGAGSNTGGVAGSNGTDSVFDTLIAVGGGGGGSRVGLAGQSGNSGGSGGGTSPADSGYGKGVGGAATTGQGQNGGSEAAYGWGGSGGGGAGAAGGDGNGNTGGNGGVGLTSAMSGASVYYAGGGGGCTYGGGGGTIGTGGLGGGGAGGKGNNGVDGTANTGGGGGGGDVATSGGAGGSGVVIVSYLNPGAVNIDNNAATGVTQTVATLNATLLAPSATAEVYAYWGTTNGGTSEGTWDHTADVGSWANVGSQNVSYSATGLTPGTTYYFAFRATTSTDSVWVSNVLSFTTIPVPTQLGFAAVPTGVGAGQSFSVTVQSQDGSGNPQNVTTDTVVSLSVSSGSLSGVTIGTIVNGTSSVAIPGLSGSTVGTVNLNATVISGMSLAAATTPISFWPFEVTGNLGLSMITTGGNMVITFTSGSGTWTPPAGVSNVEALVVGGGGGGGLDGGGGGGAGGVIHNTGINVSGPISVTVGGGGIGATRGGVAPSNGTNSVFSSLTAIGGGLGGGWGYGGPNTGGSGGGGFYASRSGGSGTALQGNNGGNDVAGAVGAGGGGAGAVGGASAGSTGGAGGDGVQYSITGSALWYGGGGGGGSASVGGVGGAGGGGQGAGPGVAGSGAANTGGGGGGAGNSADTYYTAGSGGSGVVIVSYAIPAAGGYDTWANGTFANGALSDKDPTHDPDSDGVTNLQEYAFGMDPTVSFSGGIAYETGAVTTHGQPIIFPQGNDYFTVFGRRTDYATSGLTYTVQFSAGLDVWVDNDDVLNPPEMVASDGTIDAISVKYPEGIVTPSGSQKPTFSRVKVVGN